MPDRRLAKATLHFGYVLTLGHDFDFDWNFGGSGPLDLFEAGLQKPVQSLLT